MQIAEHPGEHGLTVAVIGGGASGTLTVVHLLRRAAAEGIAMRVVLVDRLGRHGVGLAYSTTHPDHLLNSPAGRMSAVAGDPDHLVRWARAAGIAHDGFLTRRDYGRYLRELLADAEVRARAVACVTELTAEVVDVTGGGPHGQPRLHLAGGWIDADVVVLATGSPARRARFGAGAGRRFVADPWAPGALERISDGQPVVVMGTGLTMVDVALAVGRANGESVVYAVSRHGLLPQPHAASAGPVRGWAALGWASHAELAEGREAELGRAELAGAERARAGLAGAGLDRAGLDRAGLERPAELRLSTLIRGVRRYVAEHPGCWQDAVDALRPQLPALWRQLPLADRRMFLRRVARYWEVHRHRMPPASARRIGELRDAGRLRLIEGQVVGATGDGDLIRVSIDTGRAADAGAREIRAGWLVDATGSAADVTRTPDELLRGLLGRGVIRADALRLGIDADENGAVLDVRGRASTRIFTLGPILRGLRYETTAIPEIRDQAAALADRLIAVARSRAEAGNAA